MRLDEIMGALETDKSVTSLEAAWWIEVREILSRGRQGRIERYL